MFDKKKLEAFLDSLEAETHFPSKVPRRGAYASVADPAIEQKMDKYDIFKQAGYQNFGTAEFPIWGRIDNLNGITLQGLQDAYGAASFPTYAGINRGYYMYGTFPLTPPMPRPMAYSPWDDNQAPPPPREPPHDKLKAKIARMGTVAPVKIENPKPAPPVPAHSPDYVGTLTAWRGWSVCAGQLEALGCDYDWVPKTANRARCQHENHTAPQMECGCGFWSFKTLELLTEALKGYVDTVTVIGTVEIWGRVIECENGFRSEYAYPKELWALAEDMEHLSWTYGVPVRKYVQPCTALVLVKKTK
jgi:hypothetical protein